MSGSIGDDIYVVDNAGDTVIELEGEGNDTIDARTSYTLSDNVENLRLMNSVGINGTGNALDNVIIGNAGTKGSGLVNQGVKPRGHKPSTNQGVRSCIVHLRFLKYTNSFDFISMYR